MIKCKNDNCFVYMGNGYCGAVDLEINEDGQCETQFKQKMETFNKYEK